MFTFSRYLKLIASKVYTFMNALTPIQICCNYCNLKSEFLHVVSDKIDDLKLRKISLIGAGESCQIWIYMIVIYKANQYD